MKPRIRFPCNELRRGNEDVRVSGLCQEGGGLMGANAHHGAAAARHEDRTEAATALFLQPPLQDLQFRQPVNRLMSTYGSRGAFPDAFPYLGI